ncbi:MAG: glycosyltransferase [Candidatus Cyclobacteriaceae bacterium M2_1C_046]
MKPVQNLLVITYWSYKEALIQTYTLPYVRIIRKILPDHKNIYLLTLEKKEYQLEQSEEKIVKEKLLSEGIIWLNLKYSKFNFATIFRLGYKILKLFILITTKGISHLHCWCTPGGAIGYILSKLTGAQLILDSYEPHAEAMVENGEWKRNSLPFKILWKLEKLQSERASCIISATAGMMNYMKEKYQVEKKCFFIKPACVNLNLFSEKNIKSEKLLTKFNLRNKIIAVYAGKLGGIYLKQEFFNFLKIAAKHWGKKFYVIMLSNHSQEEINYLCELSGFPKNQIMVKYVSHEEIPDYMGLADFAITPVKPVPTKRYCTPIKDGEYWALGLPVVITKDISDDSEIINKFHIGSVIESLDEHSFKNSIIEIDSILKNNNRMDLYKEIRKIAVSYRSFEIADEVYKKVYDRNI